MELPAGGGRDPNEDLNSNGSGEGIRWWTAKVKTWNVLAAK